MKKGIWVLLGILVFTDFLSAQLESYNISAFYRPDLERKSLTISPDFRLDFDKFNDFKQINIRTDLGVWYASLVNSSEKQQSTSIRSDIDFQYYKEDPSSITSGEQFYKIIPQVSYTSTNRNFYKSKRFIENNPFISMEYTHRNEGDEDARNRVELFASYPVYHGWGRIENVTDAWHGLTILEELKNKGVLARELNHGEITDFANRIAEIKNQRVLDFRLKNIYEYEALESYLTEKNIVDKTSMRFYSTLNDTWIFEDFTLRTHGQMFRIGVIPTISYRSSIGFGNTDIFSWSIGPRISFIKNKVINKDWQWDQSYSLTYKYQKDKSSSPNSNDFEFDLSEVSFISNFGLGYFPSLRHNYQLQFVLSYSIGSENSFAFKTSDFLPFASFGYKYYFSPATQLRIDASISYQNRTGTITNRRIRWFTDLSIGLNHAFF